MFVGPSYFVVLSFKVFIQNKHGEHKNYLNLFQIVGIEEFKIIFFCLLFDLFKWIL